MRKWSALLSFSCSSSSRSSPFPPKKPFFINCSCVNIVLKPNGFALLFIVFPASSVFSFVSAVEEVVDDDADVVEDDDDERGANNNEDEDEDEDDDDDDDEDEDEDEDDAEDDEDDEDDGS